MTYQDEREHFVATMIQEGMCVETAQYIMRRANTIQRLNAAECNGDYPCDNGERKVKPCSKCESGYVPSSLSKHGRCPNCRAQEHIERILKTTAFKPVFQGDPRGSCVKIAVPSGKYDDWGKEGICVPTRRY